MDKVKNFRRDLQVNRTVRDETAAYHRAGSRADESAQREPSWVTVFLIVVALSIVALPRTLNSSDLLAIVIIVSALVFALRTFRI